jgi:hypothetical protein
LILQNLSWLALLNAHLIHISVRKSTVWCVTTFETAAAGLEVVTSSETLTVETCQEFGGRVSVEIGKAEGVGCYIPSWAEPEEVGERGVGIAGFGGQDGVDRRVCVIDAGCVLRGELGEVVLEILSGKCNA